MMAWTTRSCIPLLTASFLCALAVSCGSGAVNSPEGGSARPTGATESPRATFDSESPVNGDPTGRDTGSSPGSDVSDQSSGSETFSAGGTASSGGNETGATGTSNPTDRSTPTGKGSPTGTSSPTGRSGPPSGSPTGGPSDSETDESESFDWGLPPTDISPTGNAGPMYGALQRGCDVGADYLVSAWQGFNNPRDVVLFAAAVELCRGHRDAGRTWYEHAVDRYGMSAVSPEGKPVCDVYKSIRSLLDQQPRDAFPCPGGSPPEYYRSGPGGLDNPLTLDVDESLATATTSAPTEISPSTS
jgi:hypothetical protein